jgi:hypothetical protein
MVPGRAVKLSRVMAGRSASRHRRRGQIGGNALRAGPAS